MPNPKGDKFSGLYTRLVRNTCIWEWQIESTACWTWTGKVKQRYPVLNVRTPDGHRTIRAHRAMLCLVECGCETELFWDLYRTYSVLQFEADHKCYANPLCINPDHLQWLEGSRENLLKRHHQPHPDRFIATSEDFL